MGRQEVSHSLVAIHLAKTLTSLVKGNVLTENWTKTRHELWNSTAFPSVINQSHLTSINNHLAHRTIHYLLVKRQHDNIKGTIPDPSVPSGCQKGGGAGYARLKVNTYDVRSTTATVTTAVLVIKVSVKHTMKLCI